MSILIRPLHSTVESELLDLHCLIRQLSSAAVLPSSEKMSLLLGNEDLKLLAAYDGSRIVGMLTLIFYRLPTGVRARIEDVAVHDQYRGQGIGKRLCQKAIELYRGSGARSLDLTSSGDRLAANGLYVSLGFELRNTNAYRFPS
ncbi:GNAT family N-acetyltransferase [Phyllobacterium zundukense]|uniref:GNAT family N-acetyltransferase n=1 Tax=Phyllobacterium zundukense TaxID=1867719 RepID=A0ACD4CVT6_9HYPH|nr:GNAT family N-acetyltransferase [Phyllobacterium zundukense]UXN57713.1 GNAT family N-acetyltransferase [Phyllobacterium zundukense]